VLDHIPTLADLCSAIADGKISATNDGLSYHVNARELRRFLNKVRALPSISDVRLLSTSSSTDTETCPVTINASIA
jgi:hypothetical protein